MAAGVGEKAITVALLATLVLGGVVSTNEVSATALPSRGDRAQAVPHRASGQESGRPRPVTVTSSYLGHNAGEPTMGVDAKGFPFVAAAEAIALNGQAPDVDVMRGDRSGRRWEIVSPGVSDVNAHSHTGDPYVYVDNHADGSRIFTIDLQLFACSLLSFSDDGGETWITNPFGCGRPVNDHQTLFAAPPVSSQTIGYPNVVYYCFHDVVSSSCTRSIDGGVTFTATGGTSFTNLQDGSQEFCGGLHGHGYGDAEGAIYIPKVHCGLPWLAISKDEGATWKRVKVSNMPAAGHEASVATDARGNIYYAFIGSDLLPYLATSRDGGKSWSKPLMIGAPGVREASLPSLDTDPRGRVVVAYMGSEHPRGTPPAEKSWHGYLTSSWDGTSRAPHFLSVRVDPSDDPLLRGPCEQTKCGPVWDFIDVVIDDQGTVWSVWVDGCMQLCARGGATNDAEEGLVVRWPE